MKKIIKIMLISVMIVMFSFQINQIEAKIWDNLPKSVINEQFPESYIPYINELKKKHPNWVFKAVHTGLDWNETIKHETYLLGASYSMSISTVPSSYGAEWKKDGKNYGQDGNGRFVTASKQAVEYIMDPRNSLTLDSIFQFETLSYTDTGLSATEKILTSVPMGDPQYSKKYKNNNVWLDMEKTYFQIINEAGKANGVNPVHLASRIKQETAGDIVNNASINGSYAGLTGLYNFFNIGATPDASGGNAVRNGLLTAQKNGWTTPELSIHAGAKELATSYIQWGQDTIYFQKFDVNNTGNAKGLYAFQYMTNILAPKSEAYITYQAYERAKLLDCAFEFHIPVYLNMPSAATSYPEVENSDSYTKDNTRVYLDDKADSGVVDIFNIRTSPSDSNNDNIMHVVRENAEGQENRTIFVRVLKGNGTGFDKIRLTDGREGYVSSQYVYNYEYVKVTSFRFEKENMNIMAGNKYQINYEVLPVNAKYKNVTFRSSDPTIASVDALGNVTAVKPGEVTITGVNEDQGMATTMKITVTPRIEISFDKPSYLVIEQELVPFIVTCGSEYEIDILNKEIAVIENGKIKGIKAGVTEIVAKIKGKETSVKATITVLDKILSDIKFDEAIQVKDNHLYKINTGTSVQQILGSIKTSYQIVVKDSQGKIVTGDEKIGTGSTIIFSLGDKELTKFTIIIYGDLDGDGDITAMDLLDMKRHLTKAALLQGDFLGAGLISRDSQEITAMDLLSVKRHLTKAEYIVQ